MRDKPSRKAMLARLATEQGRAADLHPNAIKILAYLAGVMNLPAQTIRVRQTHVAEETRLDQRTVRRWFKYLQDETPFLIDLDRGLRNRSHRYRLNLNLETVRTSKGQLSYNALWSDLLVTDGLTYESSLSSASLPPQDPAPPEERKDMVAPSPARASTARGNGKRAVDPIKPKKRYKRGDWIPNRISGFCTACTLPLGPQQGRAITFDPDSDKPTRLHCPAHWDEAIRLAKAGKPPAKHKGFADLTRQERRNFEEAQQMRELLERTRRL